MLSQLVPEKEMSKIMNSILKYQVKNILQGASPCLCSGFLSVIHALPTLIGEIAAVSLMFCTVSRRVL